MARCLDCLEKTSSRHLVDFFLPTGLKHNGTLLFNPVKRAETVKFFFTNVGPNIAKWIPKGKKSPMTYLNDKILKSFYFYPTTLDEIIKIIKPSGLNSLATAILKNCADIRRISKPLQNSKSYTII